MSKNTKKGFTIVELLTVMSIIIILMGVLVPALNRVRRYAKIVTQKGQFHEISKGLELYRNDHQENYPDSGAGDPCGVGYCGAMKLCEAMLGQDGVGFNPLSHFTADGVADACDLYPFSLCVSIDSSVYSGTNPARPELASSLQQRIKYVDAENIKTVRLQDMYTWAIITNGTSFFNPQVTFSANSRIDGDPYHNAVIGDVFLKADIKTAWCKDRAGQKVGNACALLQGRYIKTHS